MRHVHPEIISDKSLFLSHRLLQSGHWKNLYSFWKLHVLWNLQME